MLAFNSIVNKIYNLVDSTSILGLINKDASALKEFSGTRVGTIRRNMQKMEESADSVWLHVPRKYNVADIPSKGTLDAAFLQSDEWIHGPAFLAQPDHEWPTRSAKEFAAPPELIKIKNATCMMTCKEQPKDDNPLHTFAEKCSSYSKLINLTARMQRLFRSRGKKRSDLDKNDIVAAIKFWEQNAMLFTKKRFQDGHYRSLRAYVNEEGKVVCAGRIPSQSYKVGYDRTELPILLQIIHIQSYLLKKGTLDLAIQ
jgi:hypothetical protein